MSGQSQDKTEEPTLAKRRKAREEGTVPRSKDLATAAGILVIVSFLPDLARGLREATRTSLSQPLPTDIDLAGALALLTKTGSQLLQMVGPLFAAIFFVTLVALSLPQGPVNAMKRLVPKPDRIAPWKGIEKLNPKKSGPKALLDMLRLTILTGAVLHLFYGSNGAYLGALATGSAEGAGGRLLHLVQGLGLRLGLAFGLLAVFDFLVERRRVEQDLKMSKQEVKEEHKKEDGDPHVRARIRRIQREQSQRRMEDVKTATVVVTNPTHVACALRYSPGSDAAPRLVMKGRDLLAQEIKRVAREAGVPTFENKPLAWALLRVPVGGEIPEHLYTAVAEVLAALERARRARARALQALRGGAA